MAKIICKRLFFYITVEKIDFLNPKFIENNIYSVSFFFTWNACGISPSWVKKVLMASGSEMKMKSYIAEMSFLSKFKFHFKKSINFDSLKLIYKNTDLNFLEILSDKFRKRYHNYKKCNFFSKTPCAAGPANSNC